VTHAIPHVKLVHGVEVAIALNVKITLWRAFALLLVMMDFIKMVLNVRNVNLNVRLAIIIINV
jgi:hypothetical protein